MPTARLHGPLRFAALNLNGLLLIMCLNGPFNCRRRVLVHTTYTDRLPYNVYPPFNSRLQTAKFYPEPRV